MGLKIRFRLSLLFILIFIFAIGFAVWPHWRLHMAIQKLDDQKISGFYTHWGDVFSLPEEDKNEVVRFGTFANARLLNTLNDPKRFVSAHRLLSIINSDLLDRLDGYWNDDFDPFNQVEVDATSWELTFDQELKRPLFLFWKKALSDPIGFSEVDRVMKFEPLQIAAYAEGDLSPCTASVAEYRLVIIATIYDQREEHPFERSYWFCRAPKADDSFHPQSSMETCLVDLVGGSASIQTQFNQTGASWVNVKMDWDVELSSKSRNFRGEFRAELKDDSQCADCLTGQGIGYALRKVVAAH